MYQYDSVISFVHIINRINCVIVLSRHYNWFRRLTWYKLYTVGQGSHLVRLSDQSPGDYCKTNIYYSCYLIFMCSPPWIYWWDFIFDVCHILIHYANIRIFCEDFIFTSLCSLKYRHNKVLINKKCFAVLSVHLLWLQLVKEATWSGRVTSLRGITLCTSCVTRLSRGSG